MDSIDCTELFVDAEMARGVVDAGGNVAIAVVRPKDHESPMISFEMRIDKLYNFLKQCREFQGKLPK